jgi:hypothetical protein
MKEITAKCFERMSEDGIKADRKEIDWDDGSLLVVKIFQYDLLKGDKYLE